MGKRNGPLSGVKVLELVGLGPAPFCGMLLADMGAEVVQVHRPNPSTGGIPLDPSKDVLNRGRQSIIVDLKSAEGQKTVLRLVQQADVFLEGFRPGVTERLGVGPDICLEHNSRLIYGRMTGWGQSGPLAPRAGHDINYIALTGVLDMIGRKGERPIAPLNLIADMGGGGMLLAFGIACALFETRISKKGQVIDAAMIDGSATLLSGIMGLQAMKLMEGERGTTQLDTGAHFYEVYETADHKFMAVGAVEPQFYATLCEGANLDLSEFRLQLASEKWPELKQKMARVFLTRTRAEWTAIFEGKDACVTPVLSVKEAAVHPHNVERQVFLNLDGILQPSVAPRFSRTPGSVSSSPPFVGEHTSETLISWGFSVEEIRHLERNGVVVDAKRTVA